MRLKCTAVALMVLAAFTVFAQDGPYKLINGDQDWRRRRLGLPQRRFTPRIGSMSATRRKRSWSTRRRTPWSARSRIRPASTAPSAWPPGRVFTSNGRGNNASIVDARTFQTLSKVETEGNPDYIMFEPKRKEVYTMNGRGNSASVIDAATGKVTATIPLGGKPEAGQPDVAAGRVYVNIEDKNTVAVIDVATHKVVANWPIAPGEEATGLAIDLKNHRLFIGASNKLMLMMDSTNGKIVGAGTGRRRRRLDVVRSRRPATRSRRPAATGRSQSRTRIHRRS